MFETASPEHCLCLRAEKLREEIYNVEKKLKKKFNLTINSLADKVGEEKSEYLFGMQESWG